MLDRTSLWRLTRNRYGRRLYELLGTLGVSAARMYRYDRRGLSHVDGAGDPPDGITAERERAGNLDVRPTGHFDELDEKDLVVLARSDDGVAGYVFASANRPVDVAAIGAARTFEGAYVWHLFVAPDSRGRGIATWLVGRALAAARETFGVDAATALVAVDNRPSQRVFEANGFKRRSRIDYYRLWGREWRSSTPIEGAREPGRR